MSSCSLAAIGSGAGFECAAGFVEPPGFEDCPGCGLCDVLKEMSFCDDEDLRQAVAPIWAAESMPPNREMR
jgi:hypothetical protein